MSWDWQTVVALAVVALAALWMAWRGWRWWRRPAVGCGTGGCNDCPAGAGQGRTSAQPLVSLRLPSDDA